MEKVLVLCAFALFLEANSFVNSIKLDENFVRCAESCLKINPYESISNNASFNSSHMVKHCAKLTSDGKCECDWEKILTLEGDCVCRNPRHRINENNQCVCDVSQCEPMKACKGTAIRREDPFDCCPQLSCEDENECPEDSFPSNQTEGEKCLCYPCRASTCREDQNTDIIRRGTNRPGTCCDLYKCEDINVSNTCIVDGKTYNDGETWLKEGCTQYECANGVTFLKLLDGCIDGTNTSNTCFSEGNVYHDGQSWMEDVCTHCTCINGSRKCVAHFCEDLPSATIRPQQDCAPMGFCKKTCAFGFRLNRKGCEMCKCKQPDPKTVQEILRLVNCTAESCDVLRLRVPPSNCSATSNLSGESCPKCTDAQYSKLTPILVGVIVFLVVLTTALAYLLYRERRRGVCTMSLHHHQATSPEGYIPMFDANLNSKKPIICTKPTVELKNFR